MPASRDGSPARGYVYAVLAAACWATGGLTAKWLFTAVSPATTSWPVPPLGIEMSPGVLAGGRALTAFLVLLAYLLIARRRELVVSRASIPFLGVFGVVGLALVHFSYYKAISLTNVATAILLEYLAPVIVLIVGVLFLGYRLTWTLPLGVTLSVLGCGLVVGAFGGDGLVVSPQGVLWGLLSAVFFASYGLMGSYAAGRFSPWTLLAWGLGFAALFWLLVLGPAEVLAPFAERSTGLAILYLAVVSTILPFGLFLVALHHIPPANATIAATVEPVIAGVGAFVLFGESMSVLQVLGGVLVIAAIAVVQLPGRAGLEPEMPPGQ